MWIDTLDALAIGLLIFIFGGILAAFFFYLRTAYKQGRWQRVRRDLFIALIIFAAWVVIRLIQNHEIEALRKALEPLFKSSRLQ